MTVSSDPSFPVGDVLREDIEILWRLTVKFVSAPKERENYQRTLAKKHLDAMARRHGAEEAERCASLVLDELRARRKR